MRSWVRTMKLVLINCYFGRLPAFFPLWLQSCGMNAKIDFILVTDAVIEQPLPANVKVVPSTLEELVRRIDEKLSIKAAVSSPYKLTDFKPAYGVIFEDYIKGYDYWGYCDVDLIFGNLMKFVDSPMTQGYDKIYQLGHLTIYKNTDRMNCLFQQSGGAFNFREVFTNSEFYSFDEHAGQMLIAKKQGVREYCREDMADISCRITRMTASRQKNYPFQVFYYENGAVYRAFIEDETEKTEEFAYIHLQKRSFRFAREMNSYYILSDRFEEKTPGVPAEAVIKKMSGYTDAKDERTQLNTFRYGKLRAFFDSTVKDKRIWIKIKISEKKVRLQK